MAWGGGHCDGFPRTRFSLGWYTGRSLTLFAAAVLVVAMLAQ